MPSASQPDQLHSAVNRRILPAATFSSDLGGVGRIGRHALLLVLILILHACFLSAVAMSACDEPVDEAAAVQTYQQFLKVLFRNPRFGTAYDRVYEFHANRGTIQAFHDVMADVAGLPELKTAEGPTTDSSIPELAAPPDQGSAALLVGMLDLQHVQGAAAAMALEQAAQLRPSDAISHWYLGKARIINRQLDLAPGSFERAITCRPAKTDLLEIYKELARTLQSSRQDAQALNAWQRLERLFPGDLRVKAQIAIALTHDGRWQDALARYESLANESKDPEQRVQANLAAADLMIQLGRPQDAIALLELQLASLDVDGWLFKEIRRLIEATFRSRDDLPGLVAYYESWIKGHTEDVDAMARLGRTLSLQNRTGESAAWYRRAIALAPSNAELRESLIEQLVRDDRLTDAIAQYEQMAQFDAGNRDHIEDWGQLYLSRTDLPLPERQTEAAAIWERLIVDRTDDPAALSRLAELMRRAELNDRAIELYRQAIDKAPNEPQYREYLGEYFNRLQRKDEAITTWKEIAAGDRRVKANLIRLAEVLNRFGQTDPALVAMRDACSLDPDPGERIKFVEMLRTAAEAVVDPDSGLTRAIGEASQGTPTHDDASPLARVKPQLLTEAFQQLDLAEQSAETQDERQQILRERVQTLIAAGQLEAQTTLLAAELNAGTNVTAERWRTLALYQDAADKLNDATASAIKVVELEPQSIPGWTILADLYERSSQLGDAIDAMRNLASLDRRGISESLKKIARFEIRLGQFDNALNTGRDVIKATPGNPEAYQFFADLAFEAGQPQAAVEALRQAVRINPGDEASLRALAKTLADEFQTPESIELYWRAFEKAQDLESQTNIVVALSNLYLRTNQFGKIIERLELRSRELNLPTEMTRCIATAYREAGDFGKSRETLERLMVDESENVSLLTELRTLAEQEHNSAQTEQYQRQIVESTGSDEERRRLIAILAQEGRYDEASKERLRLAESRTDRVEILKEIEILVSGGYDDVAEMLCQRLLQHSKDDWEALNAYRGVLLRNHQLAEAREVSRRILQLDVDFDAPASTSTLQSRDSHAANSSTLESQATTATDTPESFSEWMIESSENPAASFGAVYCECAGSLVFRVGASAPQADLDIVFAPHLSDRDQLRLAAWLMRSVTVRSPASTEVWTALEDFLNGPPSPARTAVQLFQTCQRYSADDLSAEGQQRLRERSLQLLKPLVKDAPAWLNQTAIPLRSIVTDGKFDDQLATLVEEQLRTIHEIYELDALLSIAASFQKPERIGGVMTALRERLAAEPEFAGLILASFSDGKSEFGSTDLFAVRPGQDPDDILALLDLAQTVGTATERPAQQSAGKDLLTLPEILIERFSVVAGSHLSGILQQLVALNAEDRVAEWCRTKTTSASLTGQVGLHLIRAELASQLDDDVAEISGLIDAAAGDPQSDDIRFLIAERAAQQGLIDEAVLLLDSMNLTDGLRQIAREEFVLRQLLPLGPSERCKLAAERLFGLPLDMDQQRDLIPILEKLGMGDKAAAIQARFSRGSMDRQSILGRQLQTYVAEGKHELAGEVAWELLKLASGGSLFSGHRPDDDRDDGGERLQAIKALGRLNRLQPLIDRYEAMLAKSPGSVELLEVLAEFHEAAEQWDLLAAKRDRIALLSKKAPPSLRAKATELERSGDVSGACDIYLTILKDDPEAFSDEMETYVQAFERAKRHADFLTAVLNLKAEHWSGHAGLIINVVAGLSQAKTNDDVVSKSIETLLANEGTRRLAIGGFLARPDVIAEEKLLPAIQSELLSEVSFPDISGVDETYLILQSVKNETSLKTLHEFLLRRAAGRQPSEQSPDAMLVYLDARLGRRADVESRIAEMQSLVPDMALISQQDRFFQILGLSRRLKEIGSDWDPVRLTLLEHLVTHTTEIETFVDTILEELGAVYESLGQYQKAGNILHQRIHRILNSTGTANGNPSESIRELLQAGEKIQHSGFPIEGARLLLNVTAHDIDEFTSDLDDDKAVAFKSRFNASQRWARQQISAEKLVNWFEIAVQSAAQDAGHFEENPASETRGTLSISDPDLHPGHSDLLLELTGTTDPRTRDAATLKTGRIDSVIVKAIEKQSFDDENLRTMLAANIRTLLGDDSPPASLLTAALAFALPMDDGEIESAVVEKLKLLEDAETRDAVPETAEQSPKPKIPAALRSAPDVAVVLAAKMLVQTGTDSGTIELLLRLAAAKAKTIDNRLVRIAVLNECLATATQAKLTDLVATLETARATVIADQIAAISIGTPGTIDLRHEIRTRLLKLEEP